MPKARPLGTTRRLRGSGVSAEEEAGDPGDRRVLQIQCSHISSWPRWAAGRPWGGCRGNWVHQKELGVGTENIQHWAYTDPPFIH